MEIINKDCLEALKDYPDNHFTSVITDPPYGLSFMGKKWDYDVPSVEIWKECLRVLKPGGTMLCFAGSRTQHRMAVNIEDAGFIIKDCLMYLYGSGFPKATDISKQLDKIAGAEREVVGISYKRNGVNGQNNEKYAQAPRETTYITTPSTDQAKQWEGYKSHSLKPSYEPIIMCMKPNDGTYAENALKHGVSGINIDASKIGEQGRFPANIILDEESSRLLDEQTGILKSGDVKPYKHSKRKNTCYGEQPEFVSFNRRGDKGGASRFFYCAKASKSERNAGCEELEEVNLSDRGKGGMRDKNSIVTRHTKTRNNHPTVKPLKLMEYLIKLIMPPKDGLILDPFAGSGTTLVAAKKLGFNAVGIERESEYCQIIAKRIEGIKNEVFDKQLRLDI